MMDLGRILERCWYGADTIWESGKILELFWVMALGRISDLGYWTDSGGNCKGCGKILELF